MRSMVEGLRGLLPAIRSAPRSILNPRRYPSTALCAVPLPSKLGRTARGYGVIRYFSPVDLRLYAAMTCGSSASARVICAV